MAKRYHREIVSEKPSPDGRGMIITEKNVRCTGSDCRHCGTQSRRPSKLDIKPSTSRDKTYSSVDDRLPTPYDFDFRPDPAARKRRHQRSYSDRSPYHSDGDAYTMSRSNSMRGASDPIPIPRSKPRRSSSMYEGDIYGGHYYDSRSRPIVHQDSGYYRDSPSRHSTSRQESARVPLGFYEVLGSSRQDKHSSHGRRRSASPIDYPQKTEEYDPERRRLRPKARAQVGQEQEPAIIYGNAPLVPTDTMYGSPRHSRRDSLSSTSPPKSVRWNDDPRLAQNQKIQNRRPRRASVSAGGDGVKSILKPMADSGRSSAAPAVQPLTDEQYNELYKSAQGIGAEERSRDDRDSRDMIEGLRKRISMDDGHRYSSFNKQSTWGEKPSSSRRRSERFYDDSRREPYYY